MINPELECTIKNLLTELLYDSNGCTNPEYRAKLVKWTARTIINYINNHNDIDAAPYVSVIQPTNSSQFQSDIQQYQS